MFTQRLRKYDGLSSAKGGVFNVFLRGFHVVDLYLVDRLGGYDGETIVCEDLEYKPAKNISRTNCWPRER